MKITYTEFYTLVQDLYDYFSRPKKPAKETIEIWMNELIAYDSSDIYDSFDWMKKNIDNMPGNLVKSIRLAMFNIIKNKPQNKLKFGDFGACEYCGSTGAFKARIRHKFGFWTEPIFFCGHCDNWRVWSNDSEIMRYSVPELNAMNIRYKPYNKTLLNGAEVRKMGTARDVKNMARSIGERKRLNTGEMHKDRRIDPDF